MKFEDQSSIGCHLMNPEQYQIYWNNKLKEKERLDNGKTSHACQQ